MSLIRAIYSRIRNPLGIECGLGRYLSGILSCIYENGRGSGDLTSGKCVGGLDIFKRDDENR